MPDNDEIFIIILGAVLLAFSIACHTSEFKANIIYFSKLYRNTYQYFHDIDFKWDFFRCNHFSRVQFVMQHQNIFLES